jgi:hypothetical protein
MEVSERRQQATGNKPLGKGSFVESATWDLRHKGKKGRRVAPALLNAIYGKEIDYCGVLKFRIIYN